jgi:hypothetical protein
MLLLHKTISRIVEDWLEIVQRGQVSLRAWNYPHYHESGVSAGGTSIGFRFTLIEYVVKNHNSADFINLKLFCYKLSIDSVQSVPELALTNLTAALTK